ncbi:hypothetical protein BDD12DRAFT_226331 [Trichophaea hybrida]|nr:hypothetical protein BDD12DRAFT_226331 [Trichophaea hybrida]
MKFSIFYDRSRRNWKMPRFANSLFVLNISVVSPVTTTYTFATIISISLMRVSYRSFVDFSSGGWGGKSSILSATHWRMSHAFRNVTTIKHSSVGGHQEKEREFCARGEGFLSAFLLLLFFYFMIAGQGRLMVVADGVWN